MIQKKNLKECFFVLLLLISGFSQAQNSQKDSSFISQVKPFGRLITGAYHNFNKNVMPNRAFEIKMALFGFKYKPNKKISAILMFDATRTTRDIELQNAGNATITYKNGSSYTVFMKLAQFEYKPNKMFTITAGQMLTDQYIFQRKHWGHLYVYYPFMEQYVYGVPADFGVKIKTSFTKWLHLTLSATNGDGPFSRQDDNADMSYSGFLQLFPGNFIFSAYYDAHIPYDTKTMFTRNAFAGLVGYKTDKFTFGAEYNSVDNQGFEENFDWGVSIYSVWNFYKKFNLLIRYDQLTGAPVFDYQNQDVYLVGLEYQEKFFRTAISFLSAIPDNIPQIAINFEVKF